MKSKYICTVIPDSINFNQIFDYDFFLFQISPDKCAFCDDYLTDQQILKCQHIFCKVCLQNNKVNSSVTCPECKETSVFNTEDLTDFTYQKTVILHNKIKILDRHSYNTKNELLQKVLRRYGTKKCACCGQKFRKDDTKFQCIVCNVVQYCSKKCRSNDSFQHKSFVKHYSYRKNYTSKVQNVSPLLLYHMYFFCIL